MAQFLSPTAGPCFSAPRAPPTPSPCDPGGGTCDLPLRPPAWRRDCPLYRGKGWGRHRDRIRTPSHPAVSRARGQETGGGRLRGPGCAAAHERASLPILVTRIQRKVALSGQLRAAPNLGVQEYQADPAVPHLQHRWHAACPSMALLGSRTEKRRVPKTGTEGGLGAGKRHLRGV
jgi:hypothetical protein